MVWSFFLFFLSLRLFHRLVWRWTVWALTPRCRPCTWPWARGKRVGNVNALLTAALQQKTSTSLNITHLITYKSQVRRHWAFRHKRNLFCGTQMEMNCWISWLRFSLKGVWNGSCYASTLPTENWHLLICKVKFNISGIKYYWLLLCLVTKHYVGKFGVMHLKVPHLNRHVS